MAEDKLKEKILLVQSPPWGIYAPPLGIAYLSAFLKSCKVSSDILDLNVEIFNASDRQIQDKWDTQDFEFWASGKAIDVFRGELEHLTDRVLSFNAGVIGFSTTFASVPFLNVLLSLIRDKAGNSVIIIAGGAGVNSKEGRSLFKKSLIDYFIIGEGEQCLHYLLSDIWKGCLVKTGQNYTVWKDEPIDNVICVKATQDGRIHIDDLPFPTFEEFNLDFYTQKDLLPLISSRGCIRSCAFCCDAPMKRPYRCRSPEKIAGEIRYLTHKYARKRFEFSDLLINGDTNSLERFCELLIDMDLGICWGGQATVRRDMGIGLFKKMKKAGCGGLTFGCESFSDRVLKIMRKGMTSLDARETFIKAKEAGMIVEINLIVGFPGETEADVDETIAFIRTNSGLIDRINSLNICTIGPGMHIYEHLEEYNIDKTVITDWYAWFNKDFTNTIQIREKRHDRLISLCSELNLNPVWQNLKR